MGLLLRTRTRAETAQTAQRSPSRRRRGPRHGARSNGRATSVWRRWAAFDSGRRAGPYVCVCVCVCVRACMCMCARACVCVMLGRQHIDRLRLSPLLCARARAAPYRTRPTRSAFVFEMTQHLSLQREALLCMQLSTSFGPHALLPRKHPSRKRPDAHCPHSRSLPPCAKSSRPVSGKDRGVFPL